MMQMTVLAVLIGAVFSQEPELELESRCKFGPEPNAKVYEPARCTANRLDYSPASLFHDVLSDACQDEGFRKLCCVSCMAYDFGIGRVDHDGCGMPGRPCQCPDGLRLNSFVQMCESESKKGVFYEPFAPAVTTRPPGPS